MNKNNILPAVGISVLILCAAMSANGGGRVTRLTVTPAPVSAETEQGMTVGQLVRQLSGVLDAAMPGEYRLSVDHEAATVTVDTWAAPLNAGALNKALRDLDYLNQWQAALEKVGKSAADTQAQFDRQGHPEYSVVCRVVSCDDHDRVLAAFERGELVYDIVAATPAGQSIEADGAAVFAGDGRYVVNTHSKKFHLPGCEYEQQIAPENRALFTGDRADLIADGYDPCDWCRP